MIKNKIKNIIFDWDGTLLDSLNSLYETVNDIFKELRVKPISIAEFRADYELPYMKFYRRYTDAPQETIDDLFKKIRPKYKAELFPGVRETLKYLKEQKVNMLILSATPQSTLEDELRDLKIDFYFRDVYGSSPDKVKALPRIIAENNLNLNETAYVGDLVFDIEAGKKAGVKTIAVLCGQDPAFKLLAKAPDEKINSIRELEGFVK